MSLTSLMDGIILETLESLYDTIPFIQNNDKENLLENIKETIETKYLQIKDKVCKEYGWDIQMFDNELNIRRDAKDPKVIKRFKIIGDIKRSIMNGKKPKVTFGHSHKLNKNVTIDLYRQIMCSHIYSSYKEVHSYIEKNQSFHQSTMSEIGKSLEVIKENRR